MALMGRKRWTVTGSSTANAAKTLSKAAPSGEFSKLLVIGYHAVVRAAVICVRLSSS